MIRLGQPKVILSSPFLPLLGDLQVWDAQMGWLVPTLKKGIIIGEWGGTLQGKDIIVQNDLAQWMVDNCITNNVYWALNPDSGDTGGIMGWDWASYDEKKIQLVNSVIADPSAFGIQHGKVCLHYGTFPNDQCQFKNPFEITPAPVIPAVQPPVAPKQQQPVVPEPEPEPVVAEEQPKPPAVEEQPQPQQPVPEEDDGGVKPLPLPKKKPVVKPVVAPAAAANNDNADDGAAGAAAAAAAPEDDNAGVAKPLPLKPKPKDIGAQNALQVKQKLKAKKPAADAAGADAQQAGAAQEPVNDEANGAIAPKGKQSVEVDPQPGTLRGRLQ